MTLPELFPGCRSPWAGYPDAVGYLGPVTQKDTGSLSHSHCIAYGKHCFSPCGCCTSCCLSSQTHPKKSCFSDFQPLPSHFLPSSIASHHLTLLSSPLFTADDLELSFPQPKIYLDAKAEAPMSNLYLLLAWGKASLYVVPSAGIAHFLHSACFH